MTIIYRAEQSSHILEHFRRGQPVALPTETVYGLAAPVENLSALSRVFSLKARPHFDPLIVHIQGVADVCRYARDLNDVEKKLVKQFWPGPLTLLLDKRVTVPDLCTAGTPWVALRSPQHPLFQKILAEWGGGLAAPSANRFGRISPTCALDVVSELGPWGLEAVLEGGVCRWGVESTLIRVVGPRKIELLRPGALSVEDIEQCLGEVNWVVPNKKKPGLEPMTSPGLLESHYAPRTPLRFFEAAALPQAPLPRTALVLQRPHLEWSKLAFAKVLCLSPGSSDVEAAAQIFSSLRSLDGENYREIWALGEEDIGLYRAINDRLRRAGASLQPHSTRSVRL